ncbi:3',5'-bisphosphate nucleotidase [Coprinellus micaceus]|uniref:3'(2'),5'-bisphosphate nucleotidase n=1 Tax=Coprinellus micaceus TaxID=71717 RepID=A0A4Y7S9W3_COPMI|nr:3',5'-bisphosphate nucleotidase [Coprinellus micaceus]
MANTSKYAFEEKVVIAAVRRACALTSSVFEKLIKNETLVKGDKSPVTVGDFAAQALISTILHNTFPNDPIVGEEDASDLRIESGKLMRERIVELANDALTAPLAAGDNVAWGIGPGAHRTSDEILEAIDRGNHPGGPNGRMWTIDPIDGTKGFLRGEQYAVCVSLIVDATVQVGVIGCPNLLVDPSDPSKGTGAIFSAVRGAGARQFTLEGTDPVSLSIPKTEVEGLKFLESVEAAHSSHSFNDRVTEVLGVQAAHVRMDSQAKYAALCRGEGGAYLRMPTVVGYKEKIWDHAPGEVLVVEAGGIVTDSRGELLNFGVGRTLGENFGVIAAGRDVHPKVIAGVQQVQAEEKSKI